MAVFFYAGHGLQVGGRNYLVPVDARLQSERDLDFDAVSLDFVLRQIELDRDGKTSIVFLDACRDNPLARNLARSMGTRSTSVGQGLAQVQTGVGTFIAYSTQPGNVAVDGAGRNSPFTAALAKGVAAPDRNLTSVMIEVRKEVLAATGGKQVPWDHSALTGDFYFELASAGGALPKVIPGRPEAEEAMQQRLRQLEEELKKKSDPQLTAKMVSLSQAKARLQQLEDSNRQDQQRIFDTYRKAGAASDPAARNAINREVGSIQMDMARRGQEMRNLREQIGTLEGGTRSGATQRPAPPGGSLGPSAPTAGEPNPSGGSLPSDASRGWNPRRRIRPPFDTLGTKSPMRRRIGNSLLTSYEGGCSSSPRRMPFGEQIEKAR